ncbi:SIMPL domain-containing protein (plasmid) [Sphingobium naphthae]|uniref:SIMPL domain-containing protein n=1 Tax=Sphingobium naphthae TaxID=1886786 RepID=UPI0037488F19
MKRLLMVSGLIALAGCTPAAPDPRGLEEDETFLTVTGSGRAEATPDQALFTAGLSSIATTAEAASARNAETMQQITAALAKLDIPARDIQTRNLSVNRITWGDNRGKYEAANTVAVRVRNTDRVGQAVAAVTTAGANIVSGPNLSVADPEKANLGAYDLAYKAARAKADAYAKAAGLRITRVLAIHDGGQGGYMPPMAEMDARMAGPPPIVAPPPPEQAPPVMAGTNAGIVTVRVDFALDAD